MYKILLLREAKKHYVRLDKETIRRVNKVAEELKENPLFGVHIKKLHGKLRGKYSYKMGEWRIIYEVDRERRLVEIWYIETRGDVYKKR